MSVDQSTRIYLLAESVWPDMSETDEVYVLVEGNAGVPLSLGAGEIMRGEWEHPNFSDSPWQDCIIPTVTEFGLWLRLKLYVLFVGDWPVD